MKTLRVTCATSLLIASAGNLFAQPNSTRDSVAAMLQSIRPNPARPAGVGASAEPPHYSLTGAGAIRSLSAPLGMHFPGTGGPPETSARQFVRQHAQALGIQSPAVDFQLKKKNSGRDRHSVRLTQTYAGVPVFGGEMVVQINAAGGVEFISGNFDRDTADLDRQPSFHKPTLSADQAVEFARVHLSPMAKSQPLAASTPELTLYVPSLLRLSGPKRLAWKMEVRSTDEQTVALQVFIDAHSGTLLQSISLICNALNRKISDAMNTTTLPGTLARSEGQPATNSVAEVHAAYDQLGDTYGFFFANFGRDGIDNNGSDLRATVRYIHLDGNGNPAPNASWDGTQMRFNPGFVIDDITGHEMTHGVTGAESGLIYLNESGAINESLSDIFGEFVDLTNGRGNDSNSVRWLLAEEYSTGAFRSMSNPTNLGSPDWIGSPYYVSPAEACTLYNDCGGVHGNSGVNNKLCYLLTDGDTFRGSVVTGMGISNVAALYYEANVNLLISSSGWMELAEALQQAAKNLGWSVAQQNNLDGAIKAVGISPRPIYLDENAPLACQQTGEPSCSGNGGPAKSFATAFSFLPSKIKGELFITGTAHTNRIARPVRIAPWSGSARIVP